MIGRIISNSPVPDNFWNLQEKKQIKANKLQILSVGLEILPMYIYKKDLKNPK